MNKSLTFLCILFSCCKFSFGQNVAKKTQVFYEKVYIQTDREVYVAGEDIWYSAWLVNAQDNRPINTSNTLYVELLSKAGENDEQKQIIVLENGRGHGDFKLSKDFPPGIYVLKAWTNWMRNFGNDLVFRKEIRIVRNPMLGGLATAPKNEKGGKVATSDQTTKAKPINQQLIQFLPEGGGLLRDVTSVVAFKAVNTNGVGLAVKGVVSNNKGEISAKFESADGCGLFVLTPVAGEKYTANCTLANGKSFSQPLPVVHEKGYTMRVLEKDSLFQVIVSTNNQSDLVGKEVLLIGKSHGKMNVKSQFTLKNTQQVVSIYKKNFPDGLTSLTLYDQDGKPHCERLVFLNSGKKVNISILPDKSSASNDELTLRIIATDTENHPVKTAFSFAAGDARMVQHTQGNIASYLLLQSELKGKIENPSQYFDENDKQRNKRLDLLLLTQGWRDFLWRRLSDSSITIKHIPETGITISGSVRRTIGDKPLEGANVTLRIIGEKQSQLISGNTDNNGRFYLDGLKFNGQQKFKATAVNKKGESFGWIALDPVFKAKPYQSESLMLDSLTISDIQPQTIAAQYKSVKRRNALRDTIMLDEVVVQANVPKVIGSTAVVDMGYADKEFTINNRDSDYVDLRHYLLTNDSRTLLDENDFIKYRAVYPHYFVNNREQFYMEFETADNYVFNKEQALPEEKVDTEIMSEITNNMLSIRMTDIKKVTVKHLVGMPPGSDQPVDFFLVFLTLKEDALFGNKKNPIIVNTEGYYQERDFYKIAIENPTASQVATFYWNPLVQTDNKGEAKVSFKIPFTPVSVKIDLQGVSGNGDIIVKEQLVEIK